MKYFEFWKSLFMFMAVSFAVESNGIEITDPVVQDHDVSNWNDNNHNQELSSAVVDGLASTSLKTHMNVSPETKIINFTFYKYVTEFLRKYVQGINTVRLASIIIHYKPHTDSCTGTVSYALVDKRYGDTLDVKKTSQKNGLITTKGNSKVTVEGKIHQMVTIRCDKESIVQMSMNFFVTVSNLKQIKLVQIVSGNNMISGTLATISIGWKTVPGEATVYEPYHAQRYYIPRMKMPELVGKSNDYVYSSIVKMAKDRHNKEVQMLNQLQKLIDNQNVINNDLDTEIQLNIADVESEIKKNQMEIEKLDKAIPGKEKLAEHRKQLEKLEQMKKE
ncbi:putative movement protein [Emaravirus cordylinae]|uniref:Putative movement protein n=1 Tax=Emaravirus cordylinae TaxID=2099567 RepID=A0A513PVW2_9VIRU|nr:putative movement protein [Emaravirus cordylinae]QAB47310.1 putative movement protein [Emaravirus cordylinae]